MTQSTGYHVTYLQKLYQQGMNDNNKCPAKCSPVKFGNQKAERKWFNISQKNVENDIINALVHTLCHAMIACCGSTMCHLLQNESTPESS